MFVQKKKRGGTIKLSAAGVRAPRYVGNFSRVFFFVFVVFTILCKNICEHVCTLDLYTRRPGVSGVQIAFMYVCVIAARLHSLHGAVRHAYVRETIIIIQNERGEEAGGSIPRACLVFFTETTAFFLPIDVWSTTCDWPSGEIRKKISCQA